MTQKQVPLSTYICLILVAAVLVYVLGNRCAKTRQAQAFYKSIDARAKALVPAATFEFEAGETFPDGSVIPEWFHDYKRVSIDSTMPIYNIRKYGVKADSSLLQTEAIQAVIDRAAAAGGGLVYVPKGTYLTASLFFKQGTRLYLEKGAVLKASDHIGDYPVIDTRMEGQLLPYFPGIINADGLDGFSISGEGIINGNGLQFWRSFWQRRKVNPKCTNLEELRPRLLFISNCRNVQICGIKLLNSPFWNAHFYRCENVKLFDLYIYAPVKPVKAPSSDAIDLDVCHNVLVKNCYMEVNDDAVALKGGKGPWADQDPANGANTNIIIEDCKYGFCHGALTLGSESIHDRNVILRRCQLDRCNRVLWLKMRPDTPQLYEHILVEKLSGQANYFLYIRPWTQFFDLKDRKDIPLSYGQDICMRNIQMECQHFFNVKASEQYRLSRFLFENLDIKATKNADIDTALIEDFSLVNVNIHP